MSSCELGEHVMRSSKSVPEHEQVRPSFLASHVEVGAAEFAALPPCVVIEVPIARPILRRQGNGQVDACAGNRDPTHDFGVDLSKGPPIQLGASSLLSLWLKSNHFTQVFRLPFNGCE